MNLKSLARSCGRALWVNWIRPLALPFVLVTAAKSAFADINYVPSGSMEPTILPGDVVFINKLAYDLRVPFTTLRLARWSEPAHGDIVVCFAPDDGTRLVKRVVGVPGDTIELRHDTLFLNGIAQTYAPLAPAATRDLDPRERAAARFASETLGTRAHAVMALPAVPARRDFGPTKLSAGQYFMMGDNRDNSRDSRYFGIMPRAEIIGEVKAVAVSGDLDHWLRPRFDRFFHGLE
jgi:signal peptidase I